jgi:hypothetical protein
VGITPVLAAISGSALMTMVIWIIVAALICWLLWWLIGYVGLPEPFNKIARVIVAVIAVVICINALLTLVGKPFINW